MKGCNYVLSTGEKLNYNQMREHLLSNYAELSKNNGTLFPSQTPPNIPPTQKPIDNDRVEVSGQKARKTYESIISRSAELSKEQIELAKKDPNRYYTPVSSVESQEVAAKIVDEIGIENAVELATSSNESIPQVIKIAILGEATSRYAKQSKTSMEVDAHDKFLSSLEKLAKESTNLGRAIAQLKEVYKLSGLGLVAKMQRALNEKNQYNEEEIRQKIQEVKEVLKKEFGDIRIEFEKKIEKEKDEEIKATINKIVSQRSEKINKAINLVRNLRSQNKNKLYDATLGIPMAILDAGLAMLEYSLMAGLEINTAIENAVDKMKELLDKEGKTFDKEAQFKKFIVDKFGVDLFKEIEEENKPISTKPAKDMAEKAKEAIEKQSKKIKIGNIELKSTSVHKLLKNILKGNEEGIDEAIKEGLGYKLSEEDSKTAIEISEKLSNPKMPKWLQHQYEEILQYLIKKNGLSNLKYFVLRDGMVQSQLSGLFNFIQNLMGFTVVFSRLFITAMKTGGFGSSLSVFLKELRFAASEASTILKNGRVSRGVAYKDLLQDKTSGEISVRYLEYFKDKNPFWKAVATQKYVGRFLEYADTFASAAASGLSDYYKTKLYVNKFHSELTAQEKAKLEFEIMYGEITRKDIKDAITDLKDSGVPNPTKTEINRTIYERIVRARDEKAKKGYDEFYNKMLNEAKKNNLTNPEDYAKLLAGNWDAVVAQGQEQAQIDTGKLSTSGITSAILIPITIMQQGLQRKVQERKSLGAKMADIAINRGVFPFVNNVARWTELGLELTPYGAVKGIGYKLSALATKEKDKKDRISDMGTDFMLRSMLGLLYTLPYFLFKGGDDDEVEDSLTTMAKKAIYGEEKVASAGKPKQTIQISESRKLPIQLLGTVSTAYMWYGEAIQSYKDLIEKNEGVPEEEKENIALKMTWASLMLTLSVAAEQSWLQSAQRYGGSIDDFKKGEIGKSVENTIGRILGSTIPLNRFQQDIGQLLNPQSKEQEDFAINIVNQFSIAKAITPGKPSIDYRGRNYDFGDVWANSADGVRKFIFGTPKYRDEIDVWLTKMNYSVSNSYRQTKAEDSGTYVKIDETGIRNLTDEEWYEFRKKTGEIFDSKLKYFYNGKDWEGFNQSEQRLFVAQLLNKSKHEAIAEINQYTTVKLFNRDLEKERERNKDKKAEKQFDKIIEKIKSKKY